MRTVTPKTRNTTLIFIALALILVAVIVFFTLQGIFSAMRKSTEIDDALLQSSTPTINTKLLDQVITNLSTKKVPALD